MKIQSPVQLTQVPGAFQARDVVVLWITDWKCPVLVTTSEYAVTAFRCHVCALNSFDAVVVWAI